MKNSTVYIRANQGSTGLGTGTGFFAGKSGYIVTNAHVVGYGPWEVRPATRVEVILSSGEKGERSLPARVYGVDADADLALLRVEADDLPPPLAFGKSADLVETQEVLIFGYPYGELLGKNISVNRSTISSLRLEGGRVAVVQVAGGMNPGNSGGPVTNHAGEVIGVSVARLRNTDTIAFAIPADIANAFMQEQIRCGGRIDTGRLVVARTELVEPPTKLPINPVIPNRTQPNTERDWKPLRLPPVKSVAISPATLEGDKVEINLPGPVDSACVGGSGQFIILHPATEKQLMVFHTSQAKVVKSIPLESPNVLFAAGAESLVVVYPATRVIERWNFTTFQKEATATLPTMAGLTPIAIAMGSGSHGPLLIQALDYPRLGERFLFNVTTLKEVPGTRTTNGVVGALPGNRLNAASDGRTFTVTAPSQARASLLAVSDAGFKEYRCPLQCKTQSPLPAGDGETVLGAGDMSDRTGTRVNAAIDPKIKNVWYLPAAHGPLHLSIAEQPNDVDNPRGRVQLSVHAPRGPDPLFTLPMLETVESLCEGPPWVWRFDGRVFFFPGAGFVAVLPRTGNKLVLHRVDVASGLAKASNDYLFVNSRPPSLIPGKRFEYPVDARSKKGGTKFRLVSGPNGMTLSPNGFLTWDVPAGIRDSARVSVTVGDSSGKEVPHNFELMPSTDNE